jgi:hypothetical protein
MQLNIHHLEIRILVDDIVFSLSKLQTPSCNLGTKSQATTNKTQYKRMKPYYNIIIDIKDVN